MENTIPLQDPSIVESDARMQCDSATLPQYDIPNQKHIGLAAPIYEPLKLCLDDDSSIDDGEEDMFDDDAFYFGDEDFQALLSRVPIKPPILHSRTTATFGSQCSHLPLHQNVLLVPDSIGISEPVLCPQLASLQGEDSLTSNGSSSGERASLGNLTLLSHESSLSHTSFNSLSKKSKARRRVSLHNDVAVVPIPSHSDYPNLVRERLWSSATELLQNAARNSVEFAAEGWNWRTVTDDEHMVMLSSGERIHPIHIRNSVNVNKVN